jgi:siroheme decarboxylase
MSAPSWDAVDRAIVMATQTGLPLCARPFQAIGAELGLAEGEVMARMQRMRDSGVIRRIAAVPNHYAIGYRANGMSVWDVDDGRIAALGARIAAFGFVSHCYHRPRHPPLWPYNLFAMVHGRDRDEVAEKIGQIADMLGDAVRAQDVLYSTRILKKTGLRLGRRGGDGKDSRCSA